jgi:type I restriction enzyme S subunit
MRSDIVLLGELLAVLTDYHANGAYKKLKENVELLDKSNYAAMIRTTNFEQNNFDESLKFINEHAYHFLKKSKVYAGDLIMNKIANAGSCYLMPELGMPVSLAMNLFLLRVNSKKANPSYVYLYLKLNEAYVKSFANGSVTKTITKDAVRNLEVVLPDRETQNDIVATYEAYTKKIQLNRQTNETLEKMAQALFKSWFVDFDPVIDNALEAGNTIPNELQDRAERRQQQLAKPDHKPLPDDIRQLFPSEFELTEDLGWVPMTWEVSAISKMIDINPRAVLPKGAVAKFADMKALPTSGYSIANVVKKAYSGGAKFKNGDVLLARITPCLENGKTGVVDFLNGSEVGFGSTEFITMREKGAIETSFVACLARDENFRKHCMQSMVGSSGRQRVQNACFDSYYMAVPDSKDLLMLFSKMTTTSFLKMSANSSESQDLEKLRDTLLPKLISGELRLPSDSMAASEQQLADATS